VNSETHGDGAINAMRYADLKTSKPKLECVWCGKHMSWDPSTKRKKHLCMQCPDFALTEEFKDARVVSDREEMLRKGSKTANVHLLPTVHCT
jgi:hypothetical protein